MIGDILFVSILDTIMYYFVSFQGAVTGTSEGYAEVNLYSFTIFDLMISRNLKKFN